MTPLPTDDPAQFIAWLYAAAKTGEWRTVFGLGLVGVVGATKWAVDKFKPELSELSWYGAYVLPWLPMFYACFASIGVDLLNDKPVLASIWRGVGIGATAAWAHKAIWMPMVKPLVGKVLGQGRL